MKKTSVLLISLALILLFTSSAFAAQASYFETTGDSTSYRTYYTSTTVSTISQTYSVTSDKLPRLNQDNKFKDDNTTHYPYEIYLPNESNPAQYRIHSNYTRSTDACASCHATHTAVGPSLLQWYTVYETCVACHDGTVTTTYNVINGEIGELKNPTYGGMFGTGTEKSLSSHNVTGAVDISAAPGGSVAPKTVTKGYGVSTIMWQSTFGCESCHTPHGQGGNARILSPDPNGYATDKNSHTDLQVSSTTGAIYNPAVGDSVYLPIITGYPYLVKIYSGTTDVTSSFKVYNDGGDSSAGAFKYGSYSYVQKKGTTNLTDITSITAVVPYQVRMQIDHYLNDGGIANQEKVRHVTGINAFCGACHVDYNTEPTVASGNGKDNIMIDKTKRPGYGVETGEFSKAHRHAVGLKWNYANAADNNYIGWNNKPMMTMGKVNPITDPENGSALGGDANATYISCLTCHFAHGTSEDFWAKWINNPDWAGVGKYSAWLPGEMKEISGSSALKRLPNMGTCEACHQKGVDAQGYLNNTSPTPAYSETVNVNDGIFTPGDNATFTNVTNLQCQNAICHQHKDKFDTFGSAIMTVKALAAIPSVQSKCIDCHGPAGNHMLQPSADNITNPRNKTISEQSATCLKVGCHVAADVGWVAGKKHFDSAVISCTTCHDTHKHSSEGRSLKREYDTLCAQCHDKLSPYTIDKLNYHN